MVGPRGAGPHPVGLDSGKGAALGSAVMWATGRWLAAVLVLVPVVGAGTVAAEERRSLTLLVTSGTGGRLETPDGRTAAELAATVRATAAEERSAGREVVAIDAGRTVAPFAESRFDGGRMMVELLAEAGVDAWFPSSVDLSTAAARIDRLAREHGVEVVRPYATGEGPPAPFVARLGGDLQVVVRNLMAAAELEDAALAGEVEALEAAPACPAPADALHVAVVHSGGHGRDLASRALTWRLVESPGGLDLVLDPDLGAELEVRRHVDGRDVFLVGRDRDRRDPWTVARIRLELVRTEGGWRIDRVGVEEVPASRREPWDPALEARLRDHMASFRRTAGRPLPPAAPSGREELERFVLEAMRERARAEITVLNRGALRPVAGERLAAPRLTYEAVHRMLSLPQDLVLAELEGSEIRALVTDSVTRVDAHGAVRSDALRFAGVSWSLGEDGVVEEIEVNGRSLRDPDRYRVATTGYLLDGGDAYGPLAEAAAKPLPGGADSLALRDDVVLPRLERASEPYADLARSPVWRYGVTRLGLGLDGVSTDRSEAYDDVSDSRAGADDSTSLRSELEAFASREMPAWRWENLLRMRYAMLESEGDEIEELDDDVRLESSAVFTGAAVVWGASPYGGAILDTELRRGRADDGAELPRQLEQSLSAGLTWSSPAWPRLRLGGVYRRYGNVDRDDQLGVLAEAFYRLEPDRGRRWPGLEGRLYAEALRGGGSEVRRLDLGLRLLVPAFGNLTLSPGFNWYLYDDSKLDGDARYLRYSVSLGWSWRGRTQRW